MQERLLGGSAILIGVAENQDDPAKPLDINKIKNESTRKRGYDEIINEVIKNKKHLLQTAFISSIWYTLACLMKIPRIAVSVSIR